MELKTTVPLNVVETALRAGIARNCLLPRLLIKTLETCIKILPLNLQKGTRKKEAINKF